MDSLLMDYPSTSSANNESSFISYCPDWEGMTDGIKFYSSSGVDDVPSNAIKLGTSLFGDAYVGAVKYLGTTMPCKIIPKTGCCYFFYGGQEISAPVSTYVTTKFGFSYEWRPTCEGEVCPETVRFGVDFSAPEKESFAVGRVIIGEERYIGNVLPSRKACLIARGGKELEMKYYDTLLVKPYPDVFGLYPGVSIYHSKGSNDIPSNAIESGVAPCGKIYVGFVEIGDRNFHYTPQWEAMPAKINPAYKLVYYPLKSKECTTSKHMFLVVNPGYKYKWIPDQKAEWIPENAVKLGRSFNGENYYVGRVLINGEQCVGKISTSQGSCYVTYGGSSFCKKLYDVLVVTKQDDGDLNNSIANEMPMPISMVMETESLPNSSGEPQGNGDSPGEISHFPDQEGMTCGTDFYVSKNTSDIPENAMKLGISPCGEAYVGAVKYHGVTVPCKIIPEKKCCYFFYGGEELSLSTYTYVVTKFGFSYEWVYSSDKNEIPPDAVRLCTDSSAVEKEFVAVGRVTIGEERSVGEIVPTNKCCFALNDGHYYWSKYYDVLVVKPNPDIYGLYPGVSIYNSKGPDDIPENAIEVGLSPSGMNYVGFVEIGDRNFHYARASDWESMPAIIKPADGKAYYSYYQKEYSTDERMFLVVKTGYTYSWEPGYSDGLIPLGAVRLGRKFNGENFYVGRVTINDEKCVAKISTPHSCCYAPHNGTEQIRYTYEVLVVTKENETLELPPPTPLSSVGEPSFSIWNPILHFGNHPPANNLHYNYIVSDEEMSDDDEEEDISPLKTGSINHPAKNWTRKPFIVNETVRLSQNFVNQQLKDLEECLEVNEGERVAEEDKERTCVVCKGNVPTRIVVPCGHDGLCRRCVELLIKEPRPGSSGSDRKPVLCPVCQSLVHTFTVRYEV